MFHLALLVALRKINHFIKLIKTEILPKYFSVAEMWIFLYWQVAGRLAEFRDLVKEVVRSACQTALLEAGFTPDDYFMDMESPMGMYAG